MASWLQMNSTRGLLNDARNIMSFFEAWALARCLPNQYSANAKEYSGVHRNVEHSGAARRECGGLTLTLRRLQTLAMMRDAFPSVLPKCRQLAVDIMLSMRRTVLADTHSESEWTMLRSAGCGGRSSSNRPWLYEGWGGERTARPAERALIAMGRVSVHYIL